jgi:hypothetical protein
LWNPKNKILNKEFNNAFITKTINTKLHFFFFFEGANNTKIAEVAINKNNIPQISMKAHAGGWNVG